MAAIEAPAHRWHYWALWFVAGLSLLLNVLLIGGLLYFRWQAGQTIAQAAQALGEVDLSNYEFVLEVDETLPIDMTVDFSDTLVVPIDTTIPVDTTIPFNETVSVPINTTIPVNTTVTVPVTIPFAGVVSIQIPISTSIPVNLNVDVPISRDIPIQIEIPVNLEVEVPIEREIPINAETPINLDIPINIPLAETGLNEIVVQAQTALADLARLFGAEVEVAR